MSRTKRVYNEKRKSMYRYGEDHEFYHPYYEFPLQYPGEKELRRKNDKLSRRKYAKTIIDLESGYFDEESDTR